MNSNPDGMNLPDRFPDEGSMYNVTMTTTSVGAEPVHSRLPPSSAYRWAECTASVSFIEANDAILPPSGGREAAEGTRAHAYLTASLKHTLGQIPDGPEMQGHIDELVRYIHSLMKPGDRLLVDQRNPLYYLPSEKGTLDVCIVGNGRIIVLDLKYGAGVSVYAEKNKQLIIYAESQLRVLEQIDLFPFDTPVHLIIYQPRDRNDPQVVREWVVTREELAGHAEEIGLQAVKVLGGTDLKFVPGEACKFCRATGICKAYAAQGLQALGDEPVDVQVDMIPAISQLPMPVITREQRQRVLAHKSALIKWLEEIENQEVAELMAGAEVQSFKLVEGKSNRQWADEQKAAKLLLEHLQHDAIYPPIPAEIISPAQAEKLLKPVKPSDEFKASFQSVITKPPGKPTLVPVTDKRPALVFNPSEGLSVVPDVEDLI